MTDTRIRPAEKQEGRKVKGKYADDVFSYAHGVVAGLIVAGEDRVLGCRRFLEFCERDDLDVRTRDADFVIGIIEATFHHRQGEALDGSPMRGKPFLLEPWQKFCVYGMLIFYHKGTEISLCHEAFIFIARKNSKTLFAAALAWGLALLRKDSGAKVYCVGASLKQSLETFDSWKYNINLLYQTDKKLSEAGWRVVDNSFNHAVINERLGGGSVSLNALPSHPDKQDSFNANIVIADEMHAFKSAKQYTILQEAMAAYTNKLMIGITTAGDDALGFCAQRLDYCRKVLKGTIRDDQYFIFICCADKDENGDVDFLDPIQHQKANPNYGVTIRPGDIMNDALQAQNDPQMRKDFLSKRLNVFVASMKSYFNLDEFRRSNARAEEKLGIPAGASIDEKLKRLARLPVKWYGGADLSKLHDLTAACLAGEIPAEKISFPDGKHPSEDVLVLIPHCWFPRIAAAEKADQDQIPLFGWRDDGWLDMPNEASMDPTEPVKQFLKWKADGFSIRAVGHDRKFARTYVTAMKRAGFRVKDQPQLYMMKSEGFRYIEHKAKVGCLCYLHAEPFEYCVQNVRATEKVDDAVQYEKIDGNYRIDVFDAAVFATIRLLIETDRSSAAAAWMEEETQPQRRHPI